MYQQFQPQNSQQATQPVKTNITTEDLREIVQRLNQKPFDEKLSLITFDEFTSLELLELLNKILIQLDKSHLVNIKEELQEKTANRISEFLKVLNYPINFDMQWQQGLVQGDKKIIYPIIYFLVTRFQECEKRAYLAKFLVPFEIQEDLQGDQDIKNMNIQYKDYQAEFQVVHQQLENSQKDSMNPTDLKKQITQMEQEKTQLLQKITLFKNKNTDKPEFQALLEVTNLLRREQEEEARLSEQLHVQRQQLEYSDQQLLMSQQRLIDARKNLSDDISSDDMLQNLRNEVRKNREISNDRLGLEINEKLRKLQMTEQLLVEPSMSNDEINNLENTVLQLKKTVKNLEERLSTQAKPADDKLAIYKQQAQLVMRKKEKLQEEIQKSEEDINKLDQKIQQKEAEVKKNKGNGYKSKDDFENYARQLREKTQKFKKLKDELKELQGENAVLNRTQQILNQKKDQISKQLESVEKSKGIMGFSDTRNKLEEISEKKGNIDEMKEKTLEEISKIVSNIENQLKQKKAKLQPQIKELKDLRKTFEQVEIEYNQKKKSYETGTASAIQQLSVVESDVKQLKQEVYKDDTKLTMLKYQSDIIDAKSKFIMDQNAFSSALQNIQNKIPKQEQDLKELKVQRELVKENHEPSLKQMNMFRDLQKLLNVKAEVMKNQGGKTGANWKQEQHTGNVNRLVLD